MAENDGAAQRLAKTAMFFTGVCSYLQLELSLLPQLFAVNRLGISEYSAGRYISYTLDTQYLFSTAAMFAASGLTFVDKLCDRFTKVLSIPVVWLFCINYGAIWKFCSFGDFNVNMFKYCWSLILSGICFGFCETFSLHIGAADTSTFEMGASLVTGTMAISSIIAKACLERKGMDIDYWMMTIQCCVSFIWSFVTAILWSAHMVCVLLADWQNGKSSSSSGSTLEASGAGASPQAPTASTGGPEKEGSASQNNKPEKLSLHEGFSNAASPFFMTQFGLGPMFLFYPLLAPMEITSDDSSYRIQVYCKICESTTGVSIWFCTYYTSLATYWGDGKKYWDLLWLLLIPQVLCMLSINVIMHYPNGWLSTYVKSRQLPSVIITTSFILGCCILQYAGYGAVYDNAVGKKNGTQSADHSKNNEEIARQVNVINNLSAFTVTSILMYFGEGYCSVYKGYRLAAEHGYKWPTSGRNWFRGFCWWVFRGFSKAGRNFANAFRRKPKFMMNSR